MTTLLRLPNAQGPTEVCSMPDCGHINCIFLDAYSALESLFSERICFKSSDLGPRPNREATNLGKTSRSAHVLVRDLALLVQMWKLPRYEDVGRGKKAEEWNFRGTTCYLNKHISPSSCSSADNCVSAENVSFLNAQITAPPARWPTADDVSKA